MMLLLESLQAYFSQGFITLKWFACVLTSMRFPGSCAVQVLILNSASTCILAPLGKEAPDLFLIVQRTIFSWVFFLFDSSKSHSKAFHSCIRRESEESASLHLLCATHGCALITVFDEGWGNA